MISLYPSQAPQEGSKAPAAAGPIRLYAAAAPASALPAAKPSVANLNGAPLLAPGATGDQKPASTLPIAPSAAGGSPVPEKTLENINVPGSQPKGSGAPAGDGSIIRQATPAEASAMPTISPVDTIKNAEKSQEDFASQADEFAATGKGPAPLPGQENYAPGKNIYFPGGGTVRSDNGPLSSVTKSVVEFPERIFNTVKDAVRVVTGNTPDDNRVPDFENATANTFKGLISSGVNPGLAALAAIAQGTFQGTLDASVIEGLLGSGAEAALRASAPDLEHISAWNLLDKPTTAEQAEANYKTLSHEFHPDKPTGSADVQAKLNDAIAQIREHGIPSDVKMTINKMLSKVSPDAAAKAEDILNKAREANKAPSLNLPAAGETTPKTPVTANIEPKAPTESPIPAPVEPVAPSNNLPAATAPKPVIPVQNSPVVDLAPKLVRPVDDIVPPPYKPSMQDTIIEKLSKPKPGIPVKDISAPVKPIENTKPEIVKAEKVPKIKNTQKAIASKSSVPMTTNSYGKLIPQTSVSLPKSEPAAVAQSVKLPSETSIAPKEGVSKIGQSIAQKAKDAGLPEIKETAKFETMKVKDQAEQAKSLRENNIDNFRSIIRGEAPLPEGVKGQAVINEMEAHLKEHPSADLAYELANSPLVTAGSEAAQEMRLMAEREPDSAMARIQEIKSNMIKKAGGTEKLTKARLADKKEITTATEKIHLSTEDLSWNKFLTSIEC